MRERSGSEEDAVTMGQKKAHSPTFHNDLRDVAPSFMGHRLVGFQTGQHFQGKSGASKYVNQPVFTVFQPPHRSLQDDRLRLKDRAEGIESECRVLDLLSPSGFYRYKNATRLRFNIMDTPSFVIVTFINEDDAPGIVVSTWIDPRGNTCYYPNVRTEEMKNKLLRKMAEPDKSWPQYQIKVLKRYGCMLSKQFAIQQSHLIQVVTDLSVQMNEVNRKLDLLLARSSLQPINQQEDTFTVPDFLTNLPVKDDTSFCHLNEQLKISHNKQSIKSAKIYDDVTEEHLKEIISDWLNQAKVRIRRRADRENKALESETIGSNLGTNE
ncbi:hypothetical protein EVAR_56265_1 [Eumeta japonica]|uniref:Uncharacterized protein n=1 Tax=Eumeta variegata TaxID=151549 RepID=A0A4C1YJ22_EUMVA|nr:hypothetical protein EVAR_56265_1 [Eumeta japonica]